MTGDRQAAHSSLLQAEADRICASAEFARAPVMRRLLNFLIAETIAGRGDELKAYGVAVDGLGRDADFDAQADSYPRVQVGRLRRMIDQFYLRYGMGQDGGRIMLPNGGYGIHWDMRPAEPAPVPEPAGAEANANALGLIPSANYPVPALIPAHNSVGQRIGTALIALFIMIGLLAAGGWAALRWQSRMTPPPPAIVSQPVPPPEIVIYPIKVVEQADPILAQRIDRVLADALPRSWMLSVRAPARELPTHGYRLTGTLVGKDRKLLYLALWDAENETQFWSQRIDASVTPDILRDALLPSISAIMAPSGVIGSREKRKLAGDYRPGFPCMMRYSEYYTAIDPEIEGPVNRCLSETLRLTPGYGPATGAMLFMRYRQSIRHPEQFEEITRSSLELAQQAVDADPYSPDAQMAFGLASYGSGMCQQGRAAVLRALDLNPYNALAQGRGAMQMYECGDKDYIGHLQIAWKLDNSLPTIMALPIIIDMAEKGQGKEAVHFANRLTSRDGQRKATYNVTMAVAYAAGGDIAGAQRQWRDATKAAGFPHTVTPDIVLRRIIYTSNMMQRIENYLRRRGVFKDSPG